MRREGTSHARGGSGRWRRSGPWGWQGSSTATSGGSSRGGSCRRTTSGTKPKADWHWVHEAIQYTILSTYKNFQVNVVNVNWTFFGWMTLITQTLIGVTLIPGSSHLT